MYVSVRQYQAAADAAEEIGRRVAAGFVPIISPAPGFVAYYAVHAGNDVVLSISIFQHDPMYELFSVDEVGEMQQRTVQRDVGADRQGRHENLAQQPAGEIARDRAPRRAC